MKGHEPPLVDVILTYGTTLCLKSLNFKTGVSYRHHIISTLMKCHTPNYANCKKQLESFKSFGVAKYIISI